MNVLDSQNNISGGFLNCKQTHFLTSVGIYVNIVMLGSIFLAMSLDFATLTSVKKVRNLQHENLPIQDINFPTKNSKYPDLGSRMYHIYGGEGCNTLLHEGFANVNTQKRLLYRICYIPSFLIQVFTISQDYSRYRLFWKYAEIGYFG